MDDTAPHHCLFECVRPHEPEVHTPARELSAQLALLVELRREGVLSSDEFAEATSMILAGV
jgi:hypothetical protein